MNMLHSSCYSADVVIQFFGRFKTHELLSDLLIHEVFGKLCQNSQVGVSGMGLRNGQEKDEKHGLLVHGVPVQGMKRSAHGNGWEKYSIGFSVGNGETASEACGEFLLSFQDILQETLFGGDSLFLQQRI